jgi:chromosome segregation ATPase
VHSLRQIWQKICARIAALFKLRPDTSPGPFELEREVRAVTHETQLLAAELQRIRDESEQVASEENRILAILDEARQEATTTMVGEAKRQADLERRVVELEAERHRSLGRIKSIETSLIDILSRLDTIDNQARESRARSREQEKAFAASLSLAITRQNTTDTRLEEFQHTSLQQVTALESSLADTTTRLEAMDGQVRTLEQKLDLEHQLYLHTVQEIQSQVRSQDQRLNWTMMAAVSAMLLGSAAGGILIWDVQKNAKILGGISTEVKQLGSAMAQSRLMGDPAGPQSCRTP